MQAEHTTVVGLIIWLLGFPLVNSPSVQKKAEWTALMARELGREVNGLRMHRHCRNPSLCAIVVFYKKLIMFQRKFKKKEEQKSLQVTCLGECVCEREMEERFPGKDTEIVSVKIFS